VFHDLLAALKRPGSWIYSSWITFLLRYRKTALGPLWIVTGPAMFILILGTLFGNVMSHDPARFIPYMAAGLVIWNYILSIASAAPRLYTQYRFSLMQGNVNHMTIVLRAVFSSFIVFLHQAAIVVAVMLIYKVKPSVSLLYLLPAGFLLFLHSVWILTALGIVGARYRDLNEVVDMAMRIAFLATPIIWMTGDSQGRGSVVGIYMLLNPFYHVLEPVRGAVLGTPVSSLSWGISALIAGLGLALARWLYMKFRHLVVLWV